MADEEEIVRWALRENAREREVERQRAWEIAKWKEVQKALVMARESRHVDAAQLQKSSHASAGAILRPFQRRDSRRDGQGQPAGRASGRPLVSSWVDSHSFRQQSPSSPDLVRQGPHLHTSKPPLSPPSPASALSRPALALSHLSPGPPPLGEAHPSSTRWAETMSPPSRNRQVGAKWMSERRERDRELWDARKGPGAVRWAGGRESDVLSRETRRSGESRSGNGHVFNGLVHTV